MIDPSTVQDQDVADLDVHVLGKPGAENDRVRLGKRVCKSCIAVADHICQVRVDDAQGRGRQPIHVDARLA